MSGSGGRPFWMSGRPVGYPGVVGRPTQMSESGLETLPYVREALSDVREWWEALPHVCEACRMFGSGRKAIPNVREWSGGPPGCLRVIGSPSQMSESGWEALLDVREWSKVYPECPGVVGMPSRMSLSGGRPFWMSGSCQ